MHVCVSAGARAHAEACLRARSCAAGASAHRESRWRRCRSLVYFPLFRWPWNFVALRGRPGPAWTPRRLPHFTDILGMRRICMASEAAEPWDFHAAPRCGCGPRWAESPGPHLCARKTGMSKTAGLCVCLRMCMRLKSCSGTRAAQLHGTHPKFCQTFLGQTRRAPAKVGPYVARIRPILGRTRSTSTKLVSDSTKFGRTSTNFGPDLVDQIRPASAKVGRISAKFCPTFVNFDQLLARNWRLFADFDRHLPNVGQIWPEFSLSSARTPLMSTGVGPQSTNTCTTLATVWPISAEFGPQGSGTAIILGR